MPTNVMLAVWNAQGATSSAKSRNIPDKWDSYWEALLSTHYNKNAVLGLMVESGWAPWYGGSDAYLSRCQEMDKKQALEANYDKNYVKADGVRSFWIPWVADLDALKTNARCSSGAILWPSNFVLEPKRVILLDAKRPYFAVELSVGKVTKLVVYLVHLTSGNEPVARQEMAALIRATNKLAPSKVPIMIVGDFNIDILNDANPQLGLTNGWFLRRCGSATWESTDGQEQSELDFALYYSPTNDGSDATAARLVEPQFVSDHAVMGYTVTVA
jgi:endonuclease/exonuclease/phosphatase family metal-dependent hydrolase